MKSDEHSKHPTADEYTKWGSNRAVVIAWIVIFLIIGGVIAYLVLTGHHLADSGRV